MTAPCDEIARDAMGLLALPKDAPERLRAEEHAKTCASCAAALAEARQLFDLLGAAVPPPPSPAALARAAAPVLAELDARTSVQASAGKLAGAVAAAVLAAWALPLALARGPLGPGSALSFGLAALAAIASVATVRWGGRLAVAFPILSALTALAVGRGPELDPTLGCPMVEALTTVGAGGLAWLATRTFARAAPPAPVVLAAVGGGALAGHAALHLACAAATELPHVLVFHTGPVALAVAVGLLLTRAPRAATTGSSRP